MGGSTGPQGTGTLIKGTYPSLADLEMEHPDGPPEDAYIINGELYIWDENDNWHSAGSLKGPAGPTEIQFSSGDNCAFSNNVSGTRSKVNVVGLGSSSIDSTSDPINLPVPAISVKTLSGGTITDIVLTLTLTLGNADAVVSVLHAFLYTATPLNANQFWPVENTEMTINLPMYPEIGTTFIATLSDLDIVIAPNTQLVFGLHNTTQALVYSFSGYISALVKMK